MANDKNQKDKSWLQKLYCILYCILTSPVWIGIGGIAAVIGLIIVIYNTFSEERRILPPSETSLEEIEFESSDADFVFPPLPSDPSLEPTSYVSDRLKPGINRFRSFEIKDGTELVIPRDKLEDTLTIVSKRMKIGRGASILAAGRDGDDAGRNGNADNGSPASGDCRNGGNGFGGEPGGHGNNGADLVFQAEEFHLAGRFYVDVSGGNGGAGQNGGNGGNGGRADRSRGCRGGNGGNGGDGGNGGNGGDGGSLQIEVKKAFGGSGELDPDIAKELVDFASDEGLGGAAGLGGRGGSGGAPRGGTVFGVGRQPGGSSGSRGQEGSEGKDGIKGPELKISVTGDGDTSSP